MPTKSKDPLRRLDSGIRTPDSIVRAHARLLFLFTVDEVEPSVRQALYRIDSSDGVSLGIWAERWHLSAPWCLAYARETLADRQRFGVGHSCWSDDPADAPGWFEGDAPKTLERRNRLRNREHFHWLARAVVKREPYTTIADDAHQAVATVSDACGRLAEFIELPLMPRRRGRPRRLP